MLSSLKDKFLNVKKNVQLFNSPEKEGTPPSRRVNLEAGSQILEHYQDEWATLHATNEENAKNAEKLAQTISGISEKIDRDKRSLECMTHLLEKTNLQNGILQCSRQINKLYDTFEHLENELVELEDVIEQTQFEQMKIQHEYHLEQYKIRKNETLENLETSLKQKYEQKAAEYESKKKHEQEERQKVFQEAFRNDLELFRNLGTIPKLDLPKKSPSALLEEIQFDYDENELNRFFEDSNPSS